MSRGKHIQRELLTKSRESALAAVQIFNNPLVNFKTETFIVLMIIAWTYLLHAYYKSQKVDYRYYKKTGKRKKFDKTKKGAYKHWELERCLNDKECPLDKSTKNNLLFLIGLRHEIEHQMCSSLDDVLGARYQACCFNYNRCIKELFANDELGIERYLSFSIQFSNFSDDIIETKLNDIEGIPETIKSFVQDFDKELPEEEFQSPNYSYGVFFTPRVVNRKGQADKVIEFIKKDSPLAKNINAEYCLIKDRDKPKFKPKQIVEMMQRKGYKNFSIHKHTKLWQKLKTKGNSQYGCHPYEEKDEWAWYQSWVDRVEQYCKEELA